MSDQPMSREDIENHCDVLAEVSIDWPVRVSLSRAIRDHDAALRVSLERCQDHQAHDTEEIVKLRAQLALKQHESQQVTAALHDDEVTTDPPLSVDVEDVRTLRAARDTWFKRCGELRAENERLRQEQRSTWTRFVVTETHDDFLTSLDSTILEHFERGEQVADLKAENERLLENLSLCKGNELANQVAALTAKVTALEQKLGEYGHQ